MTSSVFGFWAMLATPVIGAAFTLLLPSFDRPLIRRVSLAVVLFFSFVLLKNTQLVLLAGTKTFQIPFGILFLQESTDFQMSLPALLALLAAGVCVGRVFYFETAKDSNDGVPRAAIICIMLLLCAAASNASSLALGLALLFVLNGFFFYLLILDGHGPKGSAGLLIFLFFCVVDWSALFAFVIWPQSTDAGVVALKTLPLAARLLFPVLAPWARLFFASIPDYLLVLYSGLVMPVALVMLARLLANASLEVSWVLQALALASAGLSALLSTHAANQRSIVIRLLGAFYAFGTFFVATGSLTLQLPAVLLAFCVSTSVSFAAYALAQNPTRRLWLASTFLFQCIPFVGTGSVIWELWQAYLTQKNASFLPSIVFAAVLILFALSTSSERHFLPQQPAQVTPASLATSTWLSFSVTLLLTSVVPLYILHQWTFS